MKEYVPVTCALHDQLEHLALRRTACRVLFRQDEKDASADGVIADIVTADGAEFLILGGERIRLDTIRDIRPLR